MGEVHKIQVNQEKLLSQPSSPPRTVPVSMSTLYQHPNARSHDGNQPPSLSNHCQDPPRKDEDWRQHDQTFRWVPPRAELTKFDGNMLVDWLEDCEYYFTISHTPEFYKVQIVISYLVGEAREWHRYYKINTSDPSWPQFINDIRDRFNPNSKNPVDEFKKVQKTGRVDDYINSFECIKARVSAKQYIDEEFYHLGLLSGLRDEIAYAVLLYNPQILKQAFKLARQIEKSLDSQIKLFKPTTKFFSHASSTPQFKTFKSKEDKTAPNNIEGPKVSESSSTTNLTLEQKRTLGLCFRCGDKFFSGHKYKSKGIIVLEEEELSDLDNSPTADSLPPDSSNSNLMEPAVITMCAADSFTKHRTFKVQGQIGTLTIIVMVDSDITHSFISPTIVNALSLPTVVVELLTVITASGTKLSTNIMCANQEFLLFNHNFFCDLRVLQVTGHDLLLEMDWLHNYSPIEMDCKLGHLTVTDTGRRIQSNTYTFSDDIQLSDQVFSISKKLHQGNQVFLAQLNCLKHVLPVPSKELAPQVQQILTSFQDVFVEPTTLPPHCPINHQITLKPGCKPIFLCPYCFSYFQKLEIEKIMADLLKNNFIQPSTSSFASPVLLVKKRWNMEIMY
jgi:Retroviral aspartyl protease/Ty3 transposon capsid-like protein